MVKVVPDRKTFNGQLAEPLAARVGLNGAVTKGASARFAYLEGQGTLTIIAGPAEGRHSDLALAYGLEEAGNRRLRLVLPAGHVGATHHRAPWLRTHRQPEVWAYDDPVNGTPVRLPTADRKDVLAQFSALEPSGDLSAELRAATRPYRLANDRRPWVADLVDWVASHAELDPAHRRSERAWHCRGQKVLRITGIHGGVRVTAGIQDADALVKDLMAPLPASDFNELTSAVEQAAHARLAGQLRKPDEHWLQAVLRRHPRSVGIEERALREVPAWRRQGGLDLLPKPASWGRGYIDLVGVDAHGTVQIVETKLAANNDPLFVLQGLDYLIFCEAYRRAITSMLGVHPSSPFAVRYVLGAPDSKHLCRSRFTPAQLHALGPGVKWSFQTNTGWFPGPAAAPMGSVTDIDLDGVRNLPTSSAPPSEAGEADALDHSEVSP